MTGAAAVIALAGTAVGSWLSILVILGRGANRVVNAGRELTAATHKNTAAVGQLTSVTADHAQRITRLEAAVAENTNEARQ